MGDTRGLHATKKNLIKRQCFVTRADIGCGCLGNILQNGELRDTLEFPSGASRSSRGTEQLKRNSGNSTSSEQQSGNEKGARCQDGFLVRLQGEAVNSDRTTTRAGGDFQDVSCGTAYEIGRECVDEAPHPLHIATFDASRSESVL
jgi:hypothetical protein